MKQSENYSWSSYPAYLSGISPQWLNTNYILNYFGKHLQRAKYKAFVEEGMDQEIDQFYKKLRKIPILGTDAFIKHVTEKYLQMHHRIDEIPEHKLLVMKEPVNMVHIVHCVTTFYRTSIQDINLVKKKSGNKHRTIAMYFAHIIGQYSFSQISSYFQNITPSGVSRAYQRLQTKMRNHEQLRQEIDKLEKIIMNMSIVQT